MKQLILVLFVLLFINTPAYTQFGAFTQRGRATGEMTAKGFLAAHNNIPLGSTIKITNTSNDKEIEVMVMGRIPTSQNRIVDLSLDVWEELGLSTETIVMLTYTPPERRTESVSPRPPDPPPAGISEPEARQPRTSFPRDISGFDDDFFEWLIAITVKPQDIEILPFLPGPNCTSLYLMQVGAFSEDINADKAERLLAALGLETGRESHNGFIRVFVKDIPAAEILSVAQRLGAVGFRQIWLR